MATLPRRGTGVAAGGREVPIARSYAVLTLSDVIVCGADSIKRHRPPFDRWRALPDPENFCNFRPASTRSLFVPYFFARIFSSCNRLPKYPSQIRLFTL